MLRSLALLAGATALLAAPLVAQAGPASVPRSVSLVAAKAASIGVALPAGRTDTAAIPVATAWNVNPAEPVSVTLVAFVDAPAAPRSGWMSGGGGSKALRPAGARLAESGGALASVPLVVFTQPMAAGQARGSRSDDLPVRVDRAGTLDLVAITQ